MENLDFFKGFKSFAILEQKCSRVPKNFKDFKGFFKGALKFKGISSVSRVCGHPECIPHAIWDPTVDGSLCQKNIIVIGRCPFVLAHLKS